MSIIDPDVRIIEGSVPPEEGSSLRLYDIVVVVEHDLETWASMDGSAALENFVQRRSEEIMSDLWGEVDYRLPTNIAKKDPTLVLSVCQAASIIDSLDADVADAADYIVRDEYESREFAKLLFLIKHLAAACPGECKVAVIGGIFEDEVITVANGIQALGIDTFVLARWCISAWSENLLNLDDALEYMQSKHADRRLTT